MNPNKNANNFIKFLKSPRRQNLLTSPANNSLRIPNYLSPTASLTESLANTPRRLNKHLIPKTRLVSASTVQSSTPAPRRIDDLLQLENGDHETHLSPKSGKSNRELPQFVRSPYLLRTRRQRTQQATTTRIEKQLEKGGKETHLSPISNPEFPQLAREKQIELLLAEEKKLEEKLGKYRQRIKTLQLKPLPSNNPSELPEDKDELDAEWQLLQCSIDKIMKCVNTQKREFLRFKMNLPNK